MIEEYQPRHRAFPMPTRWEITQPVHFPRHQRKICGLVAMGGVARCELGWQHLSAGYTLHAGFTPEYGRVIW
jgi:hypothetical protein